MNAPLPLSPPPVEADAGVDIDTRILLVEQRLIAREERLHRGLSDLVGEARRRLQPRRLIAPIGGALLAALALRALWRSPAPAQRAAAAGHAAPDGSAAEVPWVRLLGLAWPLLPARWRDRVNPAVASSVLTLGLPLLERLLAGRRARPPLATVDAADPMGLRGRWFLAAELPAPLEAEPVEPPELGLLPREDGQFEVLQRRIDRHGTHGREGLLQPVPGSQGTRFRFSHWPVSLQWLPWAWTELRLLHVDAGYDEAVLGSPERDLLWLLSRQPALAAERRLALVQLARDRGFAVERLRFASPT